MNSECREDHPENIEEDETFRQIRLTSRREITWTIRDFKSWITADHHYSLDSPPFEFENATWCLRLSRRVKDIEFDIIRLSSRVPHHRLRYNLIWPDGYYDGPFIYDDVDIEKDLFLEELMLFMRLREIPSVGWTKIFILVCQISSEGLPVVDAFSQTEQDSKIVDADLCQNFKDLLLNGQDHDLVLKVKDEEFRAHRNILRARSPVFESMLRHDMIEKHSGTIDIPDCDPGAFEQFLLYLYSGEVETLDASVMLSLYYVADKYDMGHLKEQCREIIKNSMTPTNVSNVIQLALNHSDADVLERATDYFGKHVNVVLRTAEWQSFAKHHMMQAYELLFIKAADTFMSEKNSNPENKRHDLKEIHLTRTLDIIWEIQDFSGLPKTADYSLDSPTFNFEHATWCLRLYPKSWYHYIGFTIVRLSSHVPHHRLHYSLMWPEDHYGVHSIVDDFDEDHKEHGRKYFINRSLPPRCTSCVDQNTFIQLECQISCYKSPVVNTFSQAALDTKNNGHLSQDFKNLLLNGQNQDFVLKVKDKEIRAHRNILRARSTVLESIMEHDVVVIPDCDPEAFEQFLLYLYGGEVETLDPNNMLALYYVAQKYDAGHLKEQCRQFIVESLTSTNVSDVLELALTHSDAELLGRATAYFVKHVTEVLPTVEWQSFGSRNFTRANELFIKAVSKKDDMEEHTGDVCNLKI